MEDEYGMPNTLKNRDTKFKTGSPNSMTTRKEDNERLLSLDGAAAEVGLANTDLLHLGAQGKLKILCGIPPHCQLVLGLRDENNKVLPGSIESALPMRSPHFLVLHQDNCLQLETQGWSLLSTASVGYSLNGSTNYRLTPLDAWQKDLKHDYFSKPKKISRSEIWAVLPNEGQPTPILRFIDLRIARSHLREYFSTLKTLEKGDVGTNEWMSDDLNIAIKTAQIFWSHPKVVKTDRKTHPDTRAIEAFLVQQGFSPKLAKCTASLVRPGFAGRGRPPAKRGSQN